MYRIDDSEEMLRKSECKRQNGDGHQKQHNTTSPPDHMQKVNMTGNEDEPGDDKSNQKTISASATLQMKRQRRRQVSSVHFPWMNWILKNPVLFQSKHWTASSNETSFAAV